MKIPTPRENPFLQWSVIYRDGGISQELLLGTEEECRAEFALQTAKLKKGNLSLCRPGSGVPVEQAIKPIFQPKLEVPDDFKPGDKPPIPKVGRPDFDLLSKYFPLENLPVEEQMKAEENRRPLLERAQAAIDAVMNKGRQQQSQPQVLVTPDLPDLQKDIAIVDEALRNLELATLVLSERRQSLIKRFAAEQTADGRQRIISQALDSLQRLQ